LADLAQFESISAEGLLRWAMSNFGDTFAISTSFQLEGMVLIDMASRISSSLRVITLDTGRLPEETYAMIERVRSRYGVRIEVVLPDAGEVQAMVNRHGPNLFYDEAPLRLLCCRIRKVRPLERKLREFRAWAVGLRRSHSNARAGVPKVEAVNGSYKLSPLVDWSKEQVEDYTRRHDVPRHPLYALGYTSIGCTPCTRATLPGEDDRAGRWWWEDNSPKECGIHFSADDRVRRGMDVLLEEVLETSCA
jgi:phosphoadenosine phosphosulfate reductase